MKKIVFVLALLLCCVCFVPTAFAEMGNYAVLMGSAAIDAPADTYVIRFEVSGYGRTTERADDESAAVLARVGEHLDGYGRLCEESFYTHEGFSGTRICAVRCMTLETDRVGEIREIINLLHDAGVSSIGEIIGFCKDPSFYEAEALRLAVDDALARAASIGIDTSCYTIEDCGGFACGYTPCSAESGAGVRFSCTVRVAFGSERENH